MVGEQIRLKSNQSSQLDRSAVRHGQLVDDRKTDGIAKRRVTGGSQLNRSSHMPETTYSVTIESILSEAIRGLDRSERGAHGGKVRNVRSERIFRALLA